MKILEYDEVDGQQVLELSITCFGWFLGPNEVKTIRRVDERVPDYFALYAVEKEEILSQVGVVTLETQCDYGVEKVGFIWGVCTKSNAARKGVAGKLMEEAHARLAAEGIRYSFLGTGKSLVAYNLYKKLGYEDFISMERMLMVSKNKKQNDVAFSISKENKTIVDLFREYSKDLLGFIKRPNNFLEVRKAWSWMPYDTVGVFSVDEEPVGYLVASREGKNLKIRELCCPKVEDFQRCVAALELEFDLDSVLYDSNMGTHGLEAIRKSGFKVLQGSWGVLMVKDLKEAHTISDIRRSYGVDGARFHMTSIDEY
jgi:ribosomal protein S18 acetylase RimI-like enzyme